MPEQRLVDMPEYKRLTDYERSVITRRLLKVYTAHKHPERGYRIGEIIDKIKAELRAGQKVQ